MRVTNNTIHIEDGYKLPGRKLKEEYLRCIRLMYPSCNVFKRSMDSLVSEWTAHNRLYLLGLFRSHTKDVDLEYPQSKGLSILWRILGFSFKRK